MSAESVSPPHGRQQATERAAAPLQHGQPFNPFRLFSGVFIPDVLVRHRHLSPTAKFLWGRLARYAGENGRVYPSVPTLAVELGLSERQVQRGLAALEREGFIRRDLRKTKRGDFTSTEYVFLWHQIFVEAVSTTEIEHQPATNGVVTDMSPRGERNVTTKIKRRLKEKTSSSLPSASTPPSPTPSHNSTRLDDDNRPKSEKAELIDLIRQSTGQAPDRRLVREVNEGLELRGVRLRDYLDDIRPRLGRLKLPPRPGFFLHHMKTWRDAQPAEKPIQLAKPESSRCPKCSSVGKTTNGYCDCAMGRDLARIEARTAKERAQGEVGA